MGANGNSANKWRYQRPAGYVQGLVNTLEYALSVLPSSFMSVHRENVEKQKQLEGMEIIHYKWTLLNKPGNE